MNMSKIKTSLLLSMFASTVALSGCNKTEDVDAPVVAAHPVDVDKADIPNPDSPAMDEADKAIEKVEDVVEEVKGDVKEAAPADDTPAKEEKAPEVKK